MPFILRGWCVVAAGGGPRAVPERAPRFMPKPLLRRTAAAAKVSSDWPRGAHRASWRKVPKEPPVERS